eukprot:TRINITY_DN15098_c0_g1_i1.p1 TRINITY_DN15098_c0_g1~~TRINITY_DN15098_c0_g1_i1.p1  ORF type:complete len:1328 (+),score=282.58 TRINITY_DN15098_c0_g1_i1:19-4002(+)
MCRIFLSLAILSSLFLCSQCYVSLAWYQTMPWKLNATCGFAGFSWSKPMLPSSYFFPSVSGGLFSFMLYLDSGCTIFGTDASLCWAVPFNAYTIYSSFIVHWKQTTPTSQRKTLTAPMPLGAGSSEMYSYSSDDSSHNYTVYGYGFPMGQPYNLYFQFGTNQFVLASLLDAEPSTPNCYQKPAGTLCRPSAGICDVPEYCDGSSVGCPTNQYATSMTVCRNSTNPCVEDGYCIHGECPVGSFNKAAGTICDTNKICDGSGSCVGDENTNYCSYLSSTSCVARSDLCKWCRSLGSCMKKADTCPSCSFLPQSDCTGDCEWCSAISYCTATSASNDLKCPQCEDKAKEDCDSSNCKWCRSSLSCIKSNSTCVDCNVLSSGYCPDYPGCMECGYPSKGFVCVYSDDRCPDCSTYDGNSVMCNATVTSFDKRGQCNWCPDYGCQEKDAACSLCMEYTRDACATNLECTYCPRVASCIPKNSNISCSCEDGNPEKDACNTLRGCSFCASSQKCEKSVMYNPSLSLADNYGTCWSCSDIPSSACESYSGCKKCRGMCIQKSESCLPCLSKSQANCVREQNCLWCVSSKICTNIYSYIQDCSDCNTFSQATCGKKANSIGCSWCDEIGCSVSCPSDQTKSSSAVGIIAGLAGFGFVAAICLLIFIVMKRRNRKEAEKLSSHASTMFSSSINEKTAHDKDVETNSILKPRIEDLQFNQLITFDSKKSVLSLDGMSEITCNQGSKMGIGKEYNEQFSVKNVSSEALEVNVHVPVSHKEHSFRCSNSSFALSPGESHTFSIAIILYVTKKATAVVFVETKGHGYGTLSIGMESEESAMISYSEIIKEKVIGEGGFGIVYKGKYRGMDVAVKEIKSWGISDPRIIEEIHREVDLMQKLRSPYIVTFVGSVITQSTMCIVMEFCERGCLSTLLHKCSKLNPAFKAKAIIDSATGLNFLHQNNIMHRDFKPDNLLVVSTNPNSVCVKLTDFGTSRQAIDDSSQQYTKGVGTPLYMAPELLDGNGYSFSSDVFSFATVSWEIWHQQKPYSTIDNTMAIITFLQSGKRLQISNCPFEAIIQACWDGAPQRRPKMMEIIKDLVPIVEKIVGSSDFKGTVVDSSYIEMKETRRNPAPLPPQSAAPPLPQRPSHRPNIAPLNQNQNQIQSISPCSDLPLGWISAQDGDGDTYYVNTITNHTQWEKPVVEGRARQAPPNSKPKYEDLPPDWNVSHDGGGATYFFNSKTNQTQWEKPRGNPQSRRPPAELPTSLPPGWISVKDQDGDTYYVNTVTNKTQWEKPSNSASQTELPKDWIAVKDQDGDTYYVNVKSNKTQWEKPTAGSGF